MTVGSLRQVLSSRFRVSSDSLVFFVDGRAIDDNRTLSQLRKDAKLTFTARGYLPVQTAVDSVTETLLFPVCGTILDLASMVQNRISVRSGSDAPHSTSADAIHSIQVSIQGRPLASQRLLADVITPGCMVDLAVGDALADQTVNRWFKFKFESGPERTFQIFSCCTLSYARYAISKTASLTFENVELFSHQKFAYPADLQQLVRDCFVKDGDILYVRAPSVPVRLEYAAKKKAVRQLISLSDRTFDVRQKVSVMLKAPFRNIQLFFGRFIMDDQVYLAQMGLSEHSVIRINVLQQGIVRLYFINLEGRQRGLSFPSGQQITFGRLAAHLYKENSIEICFVWEGHVVSRYKVIDDVVCDPLVPIYYIPRLLVVDVMFEKHPEWKMQVPVTVDTTIADVLNQVIEQHITMKEKNVIVQVAGRDAKHETTKLIDLDPELEGPIHVRRISFYQGLAPFNFVIEGETFSALIHVDNPTFLGAMEAIAPRLLIDPAALLILVGDRRLGETSRLSRGITYQVEICHWERDFVIELVPELNPDLMARGWDGKHVRRVLVDLGEVKRVDGLIDYLTEHEGIGPIEVVPSGISPFPGEKPLALLPKGQVITVRYRLPATAVKYIFTSIASPQGREWCSAQCDTSVPALKMHLTHVCGKDTLLPASLRMTFWEVELTDDNKIMDYAIPADSLIDIRLRPTEKLCVFDPLDDPIKPLLD
jgi:hypothetical protein